MYAQGIGCLDYLLFSGNICKVPTKQAFDAGLGTSFLHGAVGVNQISLDSADLQLPTCAQGSFSMALSLPMKTTGCCVDQNDDLSKLLVSRTLPYKFKGNIFPDWNVMATMEGIPI